MQFTRATLVAAVAAAVISVGVTQRAEAQQPQPQPQPDSIPRPLPLPTDSVTPQPPAAPPAAAMPGRRDMEITSSFLVAAIDSTAERTQALAAATVTDVQLIDVSNLVQESDSAIINEALTRNDSSLMQLHTALSANEPIAQALRENETPIDVSQVVAVDVREGGNVAVFYRKPAAAPAPAIRPPTR